MTDNIPELGVDEHVPRVPGLALLPRTGDVAEGDLGGDDQAGQPQHQQRDPSHLQTGLGLDNDWLGPGRVREYLYSFLTSQVRKQDGRKENELVCKSGIRTEV